MGEQWEDTGPRGLLGTGFGGREAPRGLADPPQIKLGGGPWRPRGSRVDRVSSGLGRMSWRQGAKREVSGALVGGGWRLRLCLLCHCSCTALFAPFDWLSPQLPHDSLPADLPNAMAFHTHAPHACPTPPRLTHLTCLGCALASHCVAIRVVGMIFLSS